MKKISEWSPWITALAFILLVICCNIPWVYYPDINKVFTGFYTEKNVYGKPAKLLLSIGLFNVICSFIPRLFFKRLNLFISGFNLAYAVKTFIIFAACYHGICPEKRAGMYLLIPLTALLMLAALFPKGKRINKNSE